MESNNERTGPCYLLDLPPELRLLIYELLYPTRAFQVYLDIVSVGTQTPPIDILMTKRLPPHHASLVWPGASLLSTCKRIKAEATTVCYESVDFSIDVDALQAPKEVPARKAWTLQAFGGF